MPISFTKKDFIILLCLAVFSLLFLLVFSQYTSPLYPGNYGWDSTVFMKIGQLMLQGKTPYKDLFDVKGPMIYFINAIGQAVYPGRLGIFLVQIPFMLLNICGLYLLARLFCPPLKALISVFLALVIYSVTLEGGNLTEEYSLPFILLVLLLTCSYWLSGSKHHPLRYSFLYGLSCACLLWTRVNNAAPAAVVIAVVFLTFLLRRQFSVFAKNLLTFLSGMLLVSLPILLFYAHRNALSDLIDGAFIFPFSYAKYGTTEKSAEDWLFILYKISPAFCPIFSGLLYGTRNNKFAGWSLASASLVSCAALIMGFGFYHYYTITIPLFTVGFCMLLSLSFRPRAAFEAVLWLLSVFSLCFCGFHYIPVAASRAKDLLLARQQRTYYGWVHSYMEQAKKIPEAEKAEVWPYGTTMYWSYITGVVPWNKYFVNQQSLALFRPSIADEMNQMLRENPPKWIACCNHERITLDYLKEVLDTAYELVDISGEVFLYRRIGE